MITETQAPKKAEKKMDWSKTRADFPILDQEVHGRPLIYFDNAATTQKPRAVVDALRRRRHPNREFIASVLARGTFVEGD